MFFTFILIYSQLFYHGLQASQPFGYIGCLPDASFNSQHVSRIRQNDGVYCIGFCNTIGFRYAATKGYFCKCASNFSTSDLNGNDSCDFMCPGRRSERCGGESSVSLYDTLPSQPFGYIGCLPDSSFNDQHTSRILLNDGVYCIGFCKTYGFRYAATKGNSCKCASNLSTGQLNGNDSCGFICPGRKSERCGGERSVSVYDTLPSQNCFEHPYGSTSLIGERRGPERQRYQNNSATMCASYCETLEYHFSGTKEKLCICGDGVNDALKSSICETKCPGNGGEICGGEDSVSLRHTGLQELVQYKKCVEDSHGVLALEHDGTKRYADHNNSATQCATKCNKSGYPLSGTKINLCICGNRLKSSITESAKCEIKCPGNKTETCGGDGSVSIRYTGYVTPYMTTSSTKMTPITMTLSTTITQKTTTPITDKPNIEGTTVTPRSTRTALPNGVVSTIYSAPETSSQNDTKGSPSTGSQMIAVYITLPGLIIVASFVAIIVWLILRHKRLVSEARDKRDEVASCYFTQALDRNITSDDKHIYNTICPDASQYGEDATQRNTAGKTNATDYLKPKKSNGTPDYLTLIDSNDTGEYTIPEDPKDSNEYLTPGDPKDSNEYLTPEVPKDSNEYLTPGDPNYTTKYRTPVDPNYSDGYVIPVDSNDTTEYSVESKQYYDDVY